MPDTNWVKSITFENDLMNSYMVVKLEPTAEIIDYQVKMLLGNPEQQLLKMHKKQMDDERFFLYNITSKISLEQFLARKKLSKHEFLTILKSIIIGLQLGRQYLLRGGMYLLDAKYIYIEPSSLETAIAYLPVDSGEAVNDKTRSFLIDLMVYKVSFENAEEGNFIYRLLNLLRSEGFGLKKLELLIYSLAVAGEAEDLEQKPAVQTKMEAQVKTPVVLKTPAMMRPVLAILLVQIAFVSIGALLLRYLFLSQGILEMNAVLGIAIIIAAIDFLVMRRLNHIIKVSVLAKSPRKKTIPVKSDKRQRSQSGQTKIPQVGLQEQEDQVNLTVNETCIIGWNESPQPYLIGCDERSYEKIVVDKPSFLIGRMKQQADYVARSSTIGKLHAEILSENGSFYIKDLNSRNGTFLNGKKLTSNTAYVIENNDIIAFANSEYKFVIS